MINQSLHQSIEYSERPGKYDSKHPHVCKETMNHTINRRPSLERPFVQSLECVDCTTDMKRYIPRTALVGTIREEAGG